MSKKKKYGRQELEAILSDVDWDFSGAWTRYGMNLLHWYPTKLAPQVASILIPSLTEEGDTICDPFCGSGSILSEAMRLGRYSIGVDISSIACMIAKARTTLIPLAHLSNRFVAFLQAMRFGLWFLDDPTPPFPTTSVEERVLQIVSSGFQHRFDEEFSRWFHPIVLRDIHLADQCIKLEPDEDIRLLLTTVLSSLLRACCSQNGSWGYIADNVVPKQLIKKNLYRLLGQRLEAIKLGMQMVIEQCASKGIGIQDANRLTSVIEADARLLDTINTGSIDCIVTSPPYANVSDNVMSQRLSMLWLGFDLARTRQIEIGARWKRSRKGSLRDYITEMQQCLLEMRRVLKGGGTLTLILGTSPRWDAICPVVDVLTEYIRDSLKMVELAKFRRRLPDSRQHGSHSVMYEDIHIYKKA